MKKAGAVSFVTFCAQVLKLTLSDPWRVLCSIAVDGAEPRQFDGTDREIARTLFGDVEEIPPAARMILIWRLGRASGKTMLAAALAVWCAWVSDLSACGPGSVPCVIVISPTKPTSSIAVTVARELVRGSALERYVVKKTDSQESFQIRRPDGRLVEIKCVAASRGGARLRGFDIIAAIFDESEFFESNADAAAGDGFAVSDRDLLSAITPRLLWLAVFLSTPWPTENLTAELFDRNHGAPIDALACIGVSTFMRPDDARLAEAVERELLRDEETARREFLCDPGQRGGRRLLTEGLSDAVDKDRPLVVRALPGSFVGFGGDLGLERDSSAIAGVGMREGLFTLLEHDEIRPAKNQPLAPAYVVRQRFAPIIRSHGASRIMLDSHYRQSATEHLTAEGLGFVDAPTGAQGKYDSYMFVRALLRSGQLRLPDAPRLLAQMRAVTATPQPGGGTKISSPRRAGQGGHGDLVSALVLAVWSARQGQSLAAQREARNKMYASAARYLQREEETAGMNGIELAAYMRVEAEDRRMQSIDRQHREMQRSGRATPGSLTEKQAIAWNRLCGLNDDGTPKRG